MQKLCAVALTLVAAGVLGGCAAQTEPSAYTAPQSVGMGDPDGPFGRNGAQANWSPGGCGAVGSFGNNISIGNCG
jgi:hypothetical protein